MRSTVRKARQEKYFHCYRLRTQCVFSSNRWSSLRKEAFRRSFSPRSTNGNMGMGIKETQKHLYHLFFFEPIKSTLHNLALGKADAWAQKPIKFHPLALCFCSTMEIGCVCLSLIPSHYVLFPIVSFVSVQRPYLTETKAKQKKKCILSHHLNHGNVSSRHHWEWSRCDY